MIQKQGRDDVTIIRRRAKKNDEPLHSGAWKVAFADFTLAMMALFMVLWVVQATPKKPREKAALGNPSGRRRGVFDGTTSVSRQCHPMPAVGPGPGPGSARSRHHSGQAGLSSCRSWHADEELAVRPCRSTSKWR